jgi:hypothetical protein
MTTTNVSEVSLEIHTPPNKELMDNCREQFKDLMDEIPVSSGSLHIIIKYVMELVEETPIKGVKQKEFAVNLLRDIFKETTDGDEEKALLALIDNGAIGNMIDLIVDASRGKLNINTVTKASKGCFYAAIPYLLKLLREYLAKRPK